jgi:hypothetical protein
VKQDSKPPASPKPPLPAAGPDTRPIPILVPVSPGRPGIFYPTLGRPVTPPPALPAKLEPTPRVETRVWRRESPKPAPKAELKVTLRHNPEPPSPMAETQILGQPAHDTPTKFIPRMSTDERRKRLLELMLEVEARLEMLDEPVPF